jgi:hypothetical protein
MSPAAWARKFDEPTERQAAGDARRRRELHHQTAKAEHEADGRNAGAVTGRRKQRRPDDVRAHRRHAGAEPSRRTCVQSRPQRPLLGKAQAGTGSIVQAPL